MRRVIGMVVGALIGFGVCYFPAAYVACDWLWPESNLCGLPVAMTMAPLGVVIGAGVGGWLARRRHSPEAIDSKSG